MDKKLTRAEFIEILKKKVIDENLPIGKAIEMAVDFNVDFPDWTSVDEQLPPPDADNEEFPDLSENCLFVDEYGNVREGWYDHTEKCFVLNDFINRTSMLVGNITHWMKMLPLPTKNDK